MQLKHYQQHTLDTLRRFFGEAQLYGPEKAYADITSEPEQAARLGTMAGKYQALDGLPHVPYVCLRLPTGGGKTILAAHSIDVARQTWLEKDFPLVLWLVPTNTIRHQTVDALKNTGHPYRQALDDAFDGRVRVFDIGDFTNILPHDLTSNACIIVGTIQTLRVKNTEGRKVYAHHEQLENHFTHVSPGAAGLERQDEGTGKGDIKFSFANLLHVHRPLMIVDEAHNAMTGLTRNLQQRVNPAAIIEFTATPKKDANTLHSATAQELKDEEMIKLPIRLEEHKTWQSAVTSAIASRAAVAQDAKKDRDYIRPIILFQAQNKDQEVTVDVLRQHLVDVEGVDEHKIAVATGDQRDLDKINLFEPECPIEFIITVEALKEGWDCSFAYVFCSVANVKSATAVEQLLGRVMRMPYARARKIPSLNKAYAHVVSTSFGEAAKAMVDKLVSMGFDEEEAQRHIEPVQDPLDGIGLFSKRTHRAVHKINLDIPASLLTTLGDTAPGKIDVKKDEKGKAVVTLRTMLTPTETKAISEKLPERLRPGFEEEVAAYVHDIGDDLTPAERGTEFAVPQMRTWIQGDWVQAETERLMEYHDWTLADYPARLDANEFSVEQTGDAFEIDLNGNVIAYRVADNQSNLALTGGVAGWTEQQLVINLDRMVHDPGIAQTDLTRWLSDLVHYLTVTRNITLPALMECKYILARKIKDMLLSIKDRQREQVFQQTLFGPEAKVDVTFDTGFKFHDQIFWDAPKYTGGKFVFQKHFTGPDNIPKFDGKGEGGEEFECAAVIDSLSDVETWVRNVSQHVDAFRLPVALPNQKWTYPDFVVKLNDGRIMLVEYKGRDRIDTKDSYAKAAVGALWENASNGKGLYLMAEKSKTGIDVKDQILAKISTKRP